MTRVAVITVSYHQYDLTLRLLEYLQEARRPTACDIFVVDNESSDPDGVEALRRHALRPHVVCEPTNLCYGGAINRVLRSVGAERHTHYCVLNNDMTVDPDFLMPLLELTRDDSVGFVGPVTAVPGGEVQSAGADIIATSPYVVHHRPAVGVSGVEEVAVVQGNAMVFSHATLERVGYIDAAYFYSWEEIDWCHRATRLGLRNLICGDSRVFHLGSHAFGGPDGYDPVVEYMLMRNMLYFLARNGFGERCVESHIDYWHENWARTTFREHDAPPEEPALAQRVIGLASDHFRAGRRGAWPEELAAEARARGRR